MSELPKLYLPVEEPRDSTLFAETEFFVSDFDNTQALTFEKVPGFMNVDQVYSYAAERVFGAEARAELMRQGGHKNRTPAEIVESLVPFVDDPSIFDKITVMSELDYEMEDILGMISHRIHDDKRPQNLCAEDLAALNKLFTDVKLDIQLDQIGSQLPEGGFWPRPVPGFLECYRLIQEARANGAQIDTAVVSAGHTKFIQKTYNIWEIPNPDVLVTADTVSLLGLEKFYSASELAKPSPLLMEMTTQQWKQMYGVPIGQPLGPDNYVLYVGDDNDKDRAFANNGDVAFFHIDPANPAESWRRVSRALDLVSMLNPVDTNG